MPRWGSSHIVYLNKGGVKGQLFRVLFPEGVLELISGFNMEKRLELQLAVSRGGETLPLCLWYG